MAGFKECFAGLVWNYPQIYDAASTEHRDKQKVMNIFEEIGLVLGLTGWFHAKYNESKSWTVAMFY